MAKGKSEEDAYAICQAQFKDAVIGEFQDSVVFDPIQKTAVSVRDGVLEYLGSEIGAEPADKMFKIYRSPATIANTAMKMPGIAMTDEHVPLDIDPPPGGGFVASATMIDAIDQSTDTKIAILNRLTIGDTLAATISAGKKELSLAYRAELVPHDVYDFEQRSIVPHHLAVVSRGRCGSMCSFIDRKPTDDKGEKMTKVKLHKAFTDADGAMNLQQIVELATALPEAIKSVPVDQLQKLLPALQQIVEAAKVVMPEEAPVEPVEKEEPEMTDEEMAAQKQEEEKKFSDAVAAAADKKARAFADEAIKRHAAVIEKARGFLPDDYSFADKATDQIMRDALATTSSDQFSDSELPLAFKLLKKPAANYKQFGDQASSKFSELKDKEL